MSKRIIEILHRSIDIGFYGGAVESYRHMHIVKHVRCKNKTFSYKRVAMPTTIEFQELKGWFQQKYLIVSERRRRRRRRQRCGRMLIHTRSYLSRSLNYHHISYHTHYHHLTHNKIYITGCITCRCVRRCHLRHMQHSWFALIYVCISSQLIVVLV